MADIPENRRLWLFGALFWVGLFAIGIVASLHPDLCGPFPEWRTSPYRLPYAVGTTHLVSQANCSPGGGHHGAYRYGYDFVMPVGTTVCAARDGVVAEIEDRYANGDNTIGHENWVKVRHADGMLTAYSHISPRSAFVRALP